MDDFEVNDGARFHPVANIFPLMAEEELRDLAADIRANGLHESIWIEHKSGLIVDGRNRFLACRRVGVKPSFRSWDGVGSLISFVLGLNLHRRHLNESQRAMVAAKVSTLKNGQHKGAAQICAASQDEAAKALSVSRRSVQTAREVATKGAPELVNAVERGKVKVSTAAVIADEPKEAQAAILKLSEKEILAKAKDIRAKKQEVNRKERITKLATIAKGNTALGTDTKYPILYVAPPWKYEAGTTDDMREIENQYPTMSFEELAAVPVGDLATGDAVIFMWAPSPKLFEAMRLLCAWGFNYRTCAVWDKETIGCGYFFRQQHELLLVAEKGSVPRPAVDARAASVFRAKRGKHSEKPEKFRRMIESMYPDLPRIELFAREKVDGWSAWGNEVAS